MRWLWKTYNSVLHRFPILTSSIQTGILVATGDIISQTLVEPRNEHSRKKINFKRTFQFFCVGTFYVGPAITMWYRLLHHVVKPGGKTYALKKMALDQIFFAPVALAGFMVIIGVVHGKTMPKIKKTFDEEYLTILVANYKLWPAAQIINFAFVPLHYQVLYVQFVALIWNTYICFKTRPDE